MERRLVPETIGDPNAERNLVWRPSVLLNELVRQLEDASDKEIHGWWRASNFFTVGNYQGDVEYNFSVTVGDLVEWVFRLETKGHGDFPMTFTRSASRRTYDDPIVCENVEDLERAIIDTFREDSYMDRVLASMRELIGSSGWIDET